MEVVVSYDEAVTTLTTMFTTIDKDIVVDALLANKGHIFTLIEIMSNQFKAVICDLRQLLFSIYCQKVFSFYYLIYSTNNQTPI